ncbi:MAG: hypothetical protein NW220_20775 [Leptolyngbyaceae cyanobacterium bins.349]|nr:hypothetical protein [Leptolyngbyaceae cyanobacterium bins.349]
MHLGDSAIIGGIPQGRGMVIFVRKFGETTGLSPEDAQYVQELEQIRAGQPQCADIEIGRDGGLSINRRPGRTPTNLWLLTEGLGTHPDNLRSFSDFLDLSPERRRLFYNPDRSSTARGDVSSLAAPPSNTPVNYGQMAQQVPEAKTNYPLQIEQGLVGDSRLWVRVNGWILNVEEFSESSMQLAGFTNYCKKPIQANRQSGYLLVETWYNRADGVPFIRYKAQMADGSRLPVDQLRTFESQIPDPDRPLHRLVPPPTGTRYPLTVQTVNDKSVVQVNGQNVAVKQQLKDSQGQVLLFLDVFYALAEKEYTVDGGSNKRRVFYHQKDGVAYEVITKYNGQLVRTNPLPMNKRIDQVIPFAWFPPNSGYGLAENARGYRTAVDNVTDPLSLVENRPLCPF